MSDYISREAFIADCKGRYCAPCKEQGKDCNGVKCRACWVDDMLSEVMDAPAADVEPVRHMAWKPLFESEITGWNPAFAGWEPIGAYVCSCCNSEATYTCNDEYELSNYCPNCGAKMDGAE